MIRPLAAIVIAAASAAVLAQAPTQTPTRIRGTLEQVDGNTLTIKARSGEVMKVKVPDNVLVIGIAKADRKSVV